MATPKKSKSQLLLPGLTELHVGGSTLRLKHSRIPHSRILAALDGSTDTTASLVDVYRASVIPVQTRTIHLLGRKSSPKITETLLGYEVQAEYKRVHCPDRVTARYVLIFTEIGCRSIKLPYDPTVTAQLLPSLEGSMRRLKEGIAALFPANRRAQGYVLRKVFAHIRARLRESAKRESASPVPDSDSMEPI